MRFARKSVKISSSAMQRHFFAKNFDASRAVLTTILAHPARPGRSTRVLALVFGISLAILGVPILANSSFTSASAQEEEQRYSTYRNPTAGLKVQYPSSWDRVSGDAPVVVYFFRPSDNDNVFQDFVSLSVEDLPPGFDLDQYLEVTRQYLADEAGDSEVGETKQTALSGQPAYEIMSTSSYEDLQLKTLAVFTVYESKAYLFGYTAQQESFNTYLSDASRMLETFEIDTEMTQDSKYATYENDSRALRLTYPATWNMIESIYDDSPKGIDLTFDVPGDQAIVMISSYDIVGEVITLEKATEVHMSEIEKGVSLLDLGERSATTLGGHPAEMVSYSGLRTYLGDQLITLQVLEVWTVVDNREYSLIYASIPDAHSLYLPLAQELKDSIEIDEKILPKLTVTGRHELPLIGFSMDIPKDWTGFDIPEEMDSDAFASSMLIVRNDADSNVGESADAFIFISSMGLKSWLEGPEQSVDQEEPEEICKVEGYTAITEVNGHKAYEFTGSCSFDLLEYYTKGYMFVTSKAVVFVAFYGHQDYDREMAEFEVSLDSLTLEGVLDLSDYQNLASVLDEDYGQILTKQTLVVNEAFYDLEIFSNSKIHNFKLAEETKRISFLVEGQEGRLGVTQVEIGKVLEGPYVVTIDGTVVQDPVIIEDRTNGRVFVSIGHFFSFLDEGGTDSYVAVTYDQNVQESSRLHAVTITGTKVVPEFPAVAVVTIIGVAAVVLIGRGRLQSIEVK